MGEKATEACVSSTTENCMLPPTCKPSFDPSSVHLTGSRLGASLAASHPCESDSLGRFERHNQVTSGEVQPPVVAINAAMRRHGVPIESVLQHLAARIHSAATFYVEIHCSRTPMPPYPAGTKYSKIDGMVWSRDRYSDFDTWPILY